MGSVQEQMVHREDPDHEMDVFAAAQRKMGMAQERGDNLREMTLEEKVRSIWRAGNAQAERLAALEARVAELERLHKVALAGTEEIEKWLAELEANKANAKA